MNNTSTRHEPKPPGTLDTEAGCSAAPCSLSDFADERAGFMSSCITMLLEHGISPLTDAPALQMWEELTAALMVAGKIPPLQILDDAGGIHGRIASTQDEIREKHRLRVERMQEIPRAWRGTKWRCCSPSWPPSQTRP